MTDALHEGFPGGQSLALCISKESMARLAALALQEASRAADRALEGEMLWERSAPRCRALSGMAAEGLHAVGEPFCSEAAGRLDRIPWDAEPQRQRSCSGGQSPQWADWWLLEVKSVLGRASRQIGDLLQKGPEAAARLRLTEERASAA